RRQEDAVKAIGVGREQRGRIRAGSEQRACELESRVALVWIDAEYVLEVIQGCRPLTPSKEEQSSFPADSHVVGIELHGLVDACPPGLAVALSVRQQRQ